MFDFLRYKENIAIISDRNETLTYSQLIDCTDDFVASIPRKGLVFTLCENLLGSLVGYVACIRNKIPQVLLDGSKDIELIHRLIDIYKPEYIWLPTSRSKDVNGTIVHQYQTYSLVMMSYAISEGFHPVNSELLVCLTTSGSTGSPKLVRISENNLLSNAESIANYLSIDHNERPITVLPMYYSYGLSVINSHLIKGATILLTDKAVLQREFWAFFKEYEATSLAGVPYTFEMLKRLRFFKMDLPSLRYMTQAGGKLSKELAKEYIEYSQEKGKKFFVMYGQTEATARMSYLPWSNALEKYSSIGISIPGGKFALLDSDGTEILEPCRDGELVYYGKNVSLGYAECRMDLSKGDDNNGCLRTGDIAQRDSDGFYYITGRMKRFVKVWGNRCNLDAIEQLCKEITSLCACVGVDDLITVFLCEDSLKDNILSMLVEKTGFNPRAFQFKTINQLPLLSNGKINYQALENLR
ncbi:MAG: AMP-binding protein [Paludibacteraceae bacterium]|nr:AMP-binding protein [Paludibacteraceae bacterium]